MKTERSKELHRARAGLCELPKLTCVVWLAALSANLVTHASALLG